MGEIGSHAIHKDSHLTLMTRDFETVVQSAYNFDSQKYHVTSET